MATAFLTALFGAATLLLLFLCWIDLTCTKPRWRALYYALATSVLLTAWGIYDIVT